jgi:hypothetical protein
VYLLTARLETTFRSQIESGGVELTADADICRCAREESTTYDGVREEADIRGQLLCLVKIHNLHTLDLITPTALS